MDAEDDNYHETHHGIGGIAFNEEENKKHSAGWKLDKQQLVSMLRKNAMERLRTKGTTFCELCSPILLLAVLVFGYSLSDVILFDAKIYSTIRLELPGAVGGLLSTLPPYKEMVNRTPGGTFELQSHGGHNNNFQEVSNALDACKELMEGPFAVPTMGEFVALGVGLSSNMEKGVYEHLLGRLETGRTFGNLLTLGTLHFAPEGDPSVRALVEWMGNLTNEFKDLRYRMHASEVDAVEYVLDHLEERTWAVVALDRAEPGNVDYTIRMNFTTLPSTYDVTDLVAIGLDYRFQRYYLSGFLTLQTTIDQFLFRQTLPASFGSSVGGAASGEDRGSSEDEFWCTPPAMIGVPFPTASYDQNLFYAAVGYLLGLAMTMSTMYPLSRLVKGVVEEKESRVRETMRIMGLRSHVHDLSWWVTGLAVFTIISTSVAALLSFTFLPASDGSLLLAYVFLFAMSEVSLALLVASCFSKAKLASIVAPCALFACVLPRYIFYGSNRHEAYRSKTWASLLSPTAFTFGADFIADYEYAGIGANWQNYSEGEFSLQTSMRMMALDALIYGLLAWYLDKALPADYGATRNPCSVVWKKVIAWMRPLWRREGTGRATMYHQHHHGIGEVGIPFDRRKGGGDEQEGQAILQDTLGARNEDFEALVDGVGEGEGVSIERLRREFGDKVAVAGLDLKLVPGDVTCLLGHNGAGKSTTISMLTGQLPPTSGDCLIWGKSVKREIDEVRRDLGICPQHDALIPLLTVREHLEMYMDIKGLDPALKGPLVSRKLEEVGLKEKEHILASALSGGQKRKLSVAIAFTGSPRFCMLDEPTSGMDPYSRRCTWDLIQRGRKGRCVLLTTHFMDEAEHLGDRVAMLSEGLLRCVGSPLFLKSRFGLGYNVTLVKAGEDFAAPVLDALVRSHIPTADQLMAAGGEVTYRLAREFSPRFPALFRELEARRESLGVGGYGVSVTTLEEVFLSLECKGRAQFERKGKRDVDDSVEDGDMVNSSLHQIWASFLRFVPRLRHIFWWNQTTTRRDGLRVYTGLVSSREGGMGEDNVGMDGWDGDEPRKDCRNEGGGLTGELPAIEMARIGEGTRDSGKKGQEWDVKFEGDEEGEQLLDRSSEAGMWGKEKNLKVVSETNSETEKLLSDNTFPSRNSDLASSVHLQERTIAERPVMRGQRSNFGWGGQGGVRGGRRTKGSVGSADLAGGGFDSIISSENDSITLNEEGVDYQTVASIGVQFWWLLWKRRVVAARDWRGGLFQIGLPAFLVVLVLFLLTLGNNLSGPSMVMSAKQYSEKTEVLYTVGEGARQGGPVTYVDIADGIESWTYLDTSTGLSEPTSTGLSSFLLDTDDAEEQFQPFQGATAGGVPSPDSFSVHPPRYGAFVFGDRVPVNVTGDWPALRKEPEAIVFLLAEAADVANSACKLSSMASGVAAEGDGCLFSVATIRGVMKEAGVDEDKLVEAVLHARLENVTTDSGVNWDTVGNNTDMKNGLDAAGNQVEQFLESIGVDPDDAEAFHDAVVNANPSDSVVDVLSPLLPYISGGGTGNNTLSDWMSNASVQFSSINYNQSLREISIKGVVFSLEHHTTEVGDVVVGVDDVQRALPKEKRSYVGELGKGRTGIRSVNTVMFNTSAPHALPAWMGELTSKTYQACTSAAGVSGESVFTTRNHPLPLTATQSVEVQTVLSLLVSLLVTIPLCYAPAAFVTFVVRERVCKSKRVQLVSGASPLALWAATYVWDLTLFFVLSVLVMLGFVAYGKDASRVFIDYGDSALGCLVLLLCYGASSLPLAYLYSFAFDGPSSAQISIAGINFLTGFGFVVAYAVLASIEKTQDFAEQLIHVFRMFPPYLLGDGLIKLSEEYYMREVLGQFQVGGVFGWEVAGREMVYMLLEAVGYLSAVLAVEYSLAAGVRSWLDNLRLCLSGWKRQHLLNILEESQGIDEDQDVKEERYRVEAMVGTANVTADGGVLIRDLSKVYPPPVTSMPIIGGRGGPPPKCAVRGMSLAVCQGECFGLLGINGAGKSTTLQVLTRDLQPTRGELTINGQPITSRGACRLLGYCPQTDPLLPLMTAEETLLFFGGLKGLDRASTSRSKAICNSRLKSSYSTLSRQGSLRDSVESALGAVGLEGSSGCLSGTLSGGNKRKLSLAVALIGNPPVLLLDEPSSGMDPGARRSMWEVISSLAATRSVVLTTHSMEECEALCDRVGIMVGGRLRCLGTCQHLKSRFGGGYTIEVRCPSSSMEQVTQLVTSLSPLARLEEQHQTLIKFSVPACSAISQERGGGSSSERVQGCDDGGCEHKTCLNERRRGEETKGLSLAHAFEAIESRREELQVWDYSISQATLETIFVSFAKDQDEETTHVPGIAYTHEGEEGTVDSQDPEHRAQWSVIGPSLV